MNSDLVMDSADALAETILKSTDDLSQRVHAVTRILFGRDATESEINNVARFINNGDTDKQSQRWSLVCQSLMISNEFFWIR